MKYLLPCLACAMLFIAQPAAARSAPDQVAIELPALQMTDQDGHRQQLEEFIGDKIVAVTFAFTSCTTICPVIDGIFRKLQARLGERLGQDYRLLTITIDPDTDIPARLRAHASKLRADPAWRFLTGPRPEVIQVLKAFGVYTTDIYSHPPTVFVVDGKQNHWSRINGIASPRTIQQLLENYRLQREARS